MDAAFVNFFKNRSEFPRFKSKRHKNTFTVPQSGRIEDSSIRIPKFKNGIKVKPHKEVKGKIGKMTISRTPTGKYFVCICTEEEIQQFPKSNKAVGVDLGIKDFVITSDGKKFKNNRYTKKYAGHLKKAQQHLSCKKKGSHGFENQRRKTAKIHQKIANSRLDTLHKVSYQLVRDNQTLCDDSKTYHKRHLWNLKMIYSSHCFKNFNISWSYYLKLVK